MNGEEIIELIGKPISFSAVQSMLKYFDYKEPEKGSYAGSIYEKEISIAFLSKWSFDTQFTDPPYQFSDKDYVETPFENPNLPQLEFIISEIHFSKQFKGSLPFELKWNDSIYEIKKLGTSNGKTINGDGTRIWYFLNETYRIQTAINKNYKLEWVRVWWINNGIKKAKKLKETIKIQNKNISPDNYISVNEYQNKKPTTEWYKNLLEDKPFYTKEIIDKTDKVLTEFINNLVIATKEKKANKVLSSVKKVVLSLNKLEGKYGHIETIEREELCPFILDAVQTTGFECDYDLTEEWREW